MSKRQVVAVVRQQTPSGETETVITTTPGQLAVLEGLVQALEQAAHLCRSAHDKQQEAAVSVTFMPPPGITSAEVVPELTLRFEIGQRPKFLWMFPSK